MTTRKTYRPTTPHTPNTEKARTWRRLHGRTDFQDLSLIKTIRDHFGDRINDPDSPDHLTDWTIIESIGYVDTGTGGIKKINTKLRDMELDREEEDPEDSPEDPETPQDSTEDPETPQEDPETPQEIHS